MFCCNHHNGDGDADVDDGDDDLSRSSFRKGARIGLCWIEV